MTVGDIFRVLRERWLVIVIAVVVGAGAAAALQLVRPPQYAASITMYISSLGGDSASSAYQAAQLSEQRVTSYVQLVGSLRVSEDVIRRTGADVQPADLASRISASTTLNTVLINVTVTDSDPERAAEYADTIGVVFADLVDELERPAAPGSASPIAARVVQQAAVPSTPSSTSLPAAVVVGILAGLVAGVAGAFLRNALDTSVRSVEHLRQSSDAPNLGVLAFDPDEAKRPLTVHDDPQAPRAEAFRQLRNNLQFIDPDNPRKVVVVTSALPSEGKTTTLANLAIALSSANSRVLVIEGDLRRPRMSELLGLDRTSGLTTVLAGRATFEQVVQPWWGGGSFDLLASGPLPPNPSELLASRQMRTLLAELRDRYDVILIDVPPLLPVADAAAVAPASDGAILLCRYGRTTRPQIAAAVEALRAVGSPVLGTVLTMAPRTGPNAANRYGSLYGHDSPVVDLNEMPDGRGDGGADRSAARHGRNGSPHRPTPRPRPLPAERDQLPPRRA